MPRRFVICLVLAFVVAAPAAGQDPYDEKEDVDSRLADVRAKLAEIESRENALTAEIGAVSGEILALERQVGDVSMRLAALEHDLALHRRKLARITELYVLRTRRLTYLRRQYAAALDRLNRRIVAIYEFDDPDAFEVLVSSASFSEVLEQLDFVRSIGRQDKRISEAVERSRNDMRVLRKRTRATKKRVAAVTQVIAVRTAQHRALRERLVARKSGLALARGVKEGALASLESAHREYAGEAAALAAQSSELAAQIRAAQAASVVRTPASLIAGDAPSASGVDAPSASGFVWPLSGPVVSAFGMRWGRMHEGIDISAGTGAPIAAAMAGTVISTGYMGGYGNLVVVDHGGGLATAYAHLSGYAVGAGQSVSQGQVVGYVGCTGHCYGPHLHFEVRVGGAAVDPLGYL
jgi:murein DD-endopeptidase MepM/ murein hydrolase activator NlpD